MGKLFTDFQHMNGTTWLYLSFLLMLTAYFRFPRFFCLRNLDLVTLFLFVPGLLACVQADRQLAREVAHGEKAQDKLAVEAAHDLQWRGYLFLFAAAGYWLVRSLVDLALVRRPRLELNLNVAGCAVLAAALFGFMLYEVLTKEVEMPVRRADNGSHPAGTHETGAPAGNLATPVLMTPVWAMVNGVADRLRNEGPIAPTDLELGVARSTASLCHLLIVAGLFLIGWKHFDSAWYGIGMGTLYLLLPITAINVEKVDHLLPAALLVWAILAFRRPLISGGLFGISTLYVFPLFLVPLWISFYWRRGALRFLGSALLLASCMAAVIRWTEPPSSFWRLWAASTAWKAWDFRQAQETLGFWTPQTQAFRLPIFVLFLTLVAAAAVWPRKKNLADLIALSAAIVVGTQFWYANKGGVYVLWFLPLLVLIAFRPNLDAHVPVADAVGWMGRWPFRLLRRVA